MRFVSLLDLNNWKNRFAKTLVGIGHLHRQLNMYLDERIGLRYLSSGWERGREEAFALSNEYDLFFQCALRISSATWEIQAHTFEWRYWQLFKPVQLLIRFWYSSGDSRWQSGECVGKVCYCLLDQGLHDEIPIYVLMWSNCDKFILALTCDHYYQRYKNFFYDKIWHTHILIG